MDSNSLFKGVKNASISLKRAVERVSVDVMGSVGLSNTPLPESFAQYDHVSTAYFAQTDSLKALRADAMAAFDAIARTTATAHSLSLHLKDALPQGPSADPTQLAADALHNAHSAAADEVLSRVERRVKKRLIAPADDELERARDVMARVHLRKKVMLDAQRYRARVGDADGSEDDRKARDKAVELTRITEELLAVMAAALPRRAALIERAVAETMEFQRRFYLDTARLLERAVEAVGPDRLAAIRASGEELEGSVRGVGGLPADLDAAFLAPPRMERRPSQQMGQQTQAAKPAATLRTSNGSTSLWDEDDDDDTGEHDVPLGKENPFDDDLMGAPTFASAPKPRHEESLPETTGSFAAAGFGTHDAQVSSQSAYPSGGIGKRESTGSYPTAGVGVRESVSAYPIGGSRQRESVYPTAKSTSRSRPPSAPPSGAVPAKPSTMAKQSRRNRSDNEADLLNFGDVDSSARSSMRPKKPVNAPAAAGVEDLLDLGGSSVKRPTRSASATAMEGDLLGDFGTPASAAPSRGRSTGPRSRNSSPSVSASTSAPTMSSSPRTSAPATLGGNTGGLEREQLRQKHDAEVKARADEKLAAVREREEAEEKERDQKDNARGAAEGKVSQWTGNGARRGNLRALLASLDSVLYASATWKTVTMDDLKANSKVKISYHKAILQVHPDKIGSKNLGADQQVLAELIFDELKNGYEVWTAEQEGRAPPPGSVGPKGGSGASSGFGNMGGMRSGMYNNMGSMGRGATGMGGMGMGGMGGMGRGMGGMGGMGMGGMGRGMSGGGMGGMGSMGGAGGMGGRGMSGGMGMGGMSGMGAYGAGSGRRGTGMGNMPQGFANSRGTQQRR